MYFGTRVLRLVPVVASLALAACGDDGGDKSGPIHGGPETCITKELDCSPFGSCVYNEENRPVCVCDFGFEGDGYDCVEVTQCETEGFCGPNAHCVTVLRQADRCDCNDGFIDEPIGDDYRPGTNCVDIDECARGIAGCDENAVCINLPGTFACACDESKGYTEDDDEATEPGTVCVDLDECAAGVHECDPHATCTNTPGGYTCACDEDAGWAEDDDPATPPGTVCVDVDECAEGLDACDPHAICTNTPGGYTCACNGDLGYAEDANPEAPPGTICVDIDECRLGLDDCDPNATCTNEPGGFTCACNPGFLDDEDPSTLPGTVCVDIDECATGANNCDPHAICTNTPGGFSCACDASQGYAEDADPATARGTACVDIDECLIGTDNCDPHALCTNFPGGFSCACDPTQGYTEDADPATPAGTVCVDIDECAAGTHNCDPHAICTNTPGGFTCACDPARGYVEDSDPATAPGTACVDVDECANGTATCDVHARCENLPGTYACACDPARGYGEDADPLTPPGTSCVDLDECALGTDDCDDHARCANTEGSFTCACEPGWTDAPGSLPGRACVDVDECAAGTYTCDPNASCANTPGAYECVCNLWFEPLGSTCVPVAPIGAGAGSGCFIDADESLRCWGVDEATGNDLGAPVSIAGQSGFVQLSQDGRCAFQRDGSLWCWSTDSSTGTLLPVWNQVGGAGGWRKPVRGWATRADNTLWNWDASLQPRQVGTESDWAEVCPGTVAICGRKIDGTVWCWLEDPLLPVADPATRIQVGTADDYLALSCHDGLTCGLRAEGKADCFWPEAIPGETETDPPTLEAIPFPIRAGYNPATGEVIDDLVEVSVGASFVCALRENGTVYCGGLFGSSGLRHGDLLVPFSEPWLARIGTDSDWRALASGFDHACGVRGNAVYCWGANDDGQLGVTGPGTLTPVEVPLAAPPAP